MTTWPISGADVGLRLDAWLAARPEIGSRGKARDAVECGKVFLNGAELTYADAARRLRAGDVVGFWLDRPGSARSRSREVVAARKALRVVHQDDDLLVVDKPPGWLVEPLPGAAPAEVTLLDMVGDLLRSAGRIRPYVVHRIDRDTSGLVLFALNPAARDALKRQFEKHTPVRVYLAVVNGAPDAQSGIWRDKLVWDSERLVQKRAHAQEERAKDAVARYRVVERFPWQSLLEISLVTGKRNRDPRAGRLPGPRAGGGAPVPIRAPTRRGARTGVRPAGAARRAPGFHASGDRAARRVHCRIARRHGGLVAGASASGRREAARTWRFAGGRYRLRALGPR